MQSAETVHLVREASVARRDQSEPRAKTATKAKRDLPVKKALKAPLANRDPKVPRVYKVYAGNPDLSGYLAKRGRRVNQGRLEIPARMELGDLRARLALPVFKGRKDSKDSKAIGEILDLKDLPDLLARLVCKDSGAPKVSRVNRVLGVLKGNVGKSGTQVPRDRQDRLALKENWVLEASLDQRETMVR